MKKLRLKQGTLAWENARERRIGSSEVFDIVKYYAIDAELQNCGLNAELVRAEKPYTTVWALYHKMLGDGLYQKGILPPELGDYGHAVEPYGLEILQRGREDKLKSGEVYVSDRLIASLDISGVSERIDILNGFYNSSNYMLTGKRFVCEQKSIMPNVLKNGLPIKYIIQAQYQITMTGADFFILQIMTLENDTIFERGKITQLSRQSKKKLAEYLDGKMSVTHIYFANNEQLAALIKACLKRFFADVDARREPKTHIPYDDQKNIIESIRINSFYSKEREFKYNLRSYIKAKEKVEKAENKRLEIVQTIINAAKNNNVSKFVSSCGYRGSFSASGAFLLKAPKKKEGD